MSQLVEGTFDAEVLSELLKKADHTFTSKKGKTYFKFSAWINDEPDQFGNTLSFQVSEKNNQGGFNKIYFGNAKPKVKEESIF